MKQFISTIICLLSCALSANCQVQVTPVFSGDNDSLVLKDLVHLNFDSTGNYSAVYKYSDYYVLKRGVPLSSWTTLFDTFKYYEEKEIGKETVQIFKRYEDSAQYCKLSNSNYLFGPYNCDMDIFVSGSHLSVRINCRGRNTNTKEKVYIDDALIDVMDTPYAYDIYWQVIYKFSNNFSNLIYYTHVGKHCRLYLNNVLIDSADYFFEGISVNDKGKYAYVKTIKNIQYLVTSDTVIGPFNKLANTKTKLAEGNIFNDGNYSYLLNDTIGDMHIINGKVQRIHLLDHNFAGTGHFYYFYKQDSSYKRPDYFYAHRYDIRRPSFYSFTNFDSYGKLKVSESNCSLNLDGKVYETNYNYIEASRMDSAGNLDYYGLRNYYIYRNTKSKESAQPLSAYGVRPNILTMAPNGSVIYLYTTADSQYLYQDDNLLAKCKKKKRSVEKLNGYDLGFEHGQQPVGLFAVTANDISYIFYNGHIIYRDTLSATFDKIDYVEIEDPITGERFYRDSALMVSHKIAKVGADGKNFFIIHESQNGTYSLFVNGKERGTLTKEKLQEINNGPCKTYYFQSGKLVFYGLRESKVYRYKIDL